MTAWRTNGRGTLMIDRVITGIGRIQRASGTHSPRELREINELITRYRRVMLSGGDQVYRSALQALHAGEITGVELLRADTEGALPELLGRQVTRTLSVTESRAAESVATAWEAWNAKTTNDDTRANRKYALARILEVSPDLAVADLPGALLKLQERYSEQAPAFNRIRASMLRFVRARLTRVHPVYEALVAVDAMPESPVQRDAPSLALSIAFRDALDPKAGAMWWSMYTTGMNPKEYDGHWDLDGEAIRIHGTKRYARSRWVPHLAAVVRRTMGWTQYRAAIATGLAALPADIRPAQGWQPNDARRGYRALLESVRLTEPRIKFYMGHELDVSQRYGHPEAMAAIAEDTPALRERLELGEQAVREARKQAMRAG